MFKSNRDPNNPGRELPKHEMRLESSSTSAGEAWSCPLCGRRVVLHSPPPYEQITLDRGDKFVLAWGSRAGTIACKKTVLEAGDENAIHLGSKAASSVELPEQTGLNEPGEKDDAPFSPIGQLPVWHDLAEDSDEAPLSDEWEAWLDEAGFDDWWTRDLNPPD